jgi:hypothetical protein
MADAAGSARDAWKISMSFGSEHDGARRDTQHVSPENAASAGARRAVAMNIRMHLLTSRRSWIDANDDPGVVVDNE